MTPSEELAESKYVLLTTYRRDRRPVPTPVWIVPPPVTAPFLAVYL